MISEHSIAPHVIVVMGVAGSGKTTAGQALAGALGRPGEVDWTFYDADDFHSPENVDKMRRGVALTDDDRAPWLATLRALISDTIRAGRHAVLACSALKEAYRDALRPSLVDASPGTIRFVYLDVPASVLHDRLAQRAHYFAPKLLDSQLATLEKPRDAVWVDGTRPVSEIVQSVRDALEV